MPTDPFIVLRQMLASADWNTVWFAATTLLILAIALAVLTIGLIRIVDNWRLKEFRTTARVVDKFRQREFVTEEWLYHPAAQMHVPQKQFHPESFVLTVDAGWGPVDVRVPRNLFHRIGSGDEVKVAYVRTRIKAEPRLTRVVGDQEVG